ncbi:MarR family transcriptional regulator [Deinococcus marmoris]
MALALQVQHLAGLLAGAEDRLAAPSGQTGARAAVLACADPQPQTVAAVARRLGLTRQSVQRTADLLVADELAEYFPNPEHKRAKLLGLTPAGQRTLTGIETAQSAWANRISAGLDEGELLRAAELLAQITRRLAARGERSGPD